MKKKNDVDVNDIYMLTNTDSELLAKDNAQAYLIERIATGSERFRTLLAERYTGYLERIYNYLTNGGDLHE